MAGRTAHEAVERYLDPIRDALGCLDAAAHIDRHGGYTVHQDGAWVLNGGSGVKLPGVGTSQVRQQFRVVECDPDLHDVTEGHFRITTLAYDYELSDQDGGWRWKMHWHPTGKSAATYPHIHLPSHPGHRATPRMLVEHAVRWANNDGAKMRRDDWEDVLAQSETNHIRDRSWSSIPRPPAE